MTAMAGLVEFLAHVVDDTDPERELPPGSPPTCESLNIIVATHVAHAPTRQIRRSLVHDTNFACIIYRNCLISAIFLLSPPMATALRASHEAERYSHDTCLFSRTHPRLQAFLLMKPMHVPRSLVGSCRR